MLISLIASAAGSPLPPRVVEHLGDRYHVVSFDLRDVQLELVGQGPGGPRTFASLGPDVRAATNAGIFHAPDDPVGLWVERGVVLHPIERGRGVGNFYLRPNGVFWVDGSGPHVADTVGFELPHGTRLATQSGPALVLEGRVHPAFDPSSTSRKVRNAVGVDGWTVHLVLSDGPVRFHDLATLFRDGLGCSDALYLDGTISGLSGVTPVPDHGYAGFLVVTDP